MYCFIKWFSINTIFHSIMAISTYFDPSLGSSFHCAIIASSDLKRHHAPLKNP